MLSRIRLSHIRNISNINGIRNIKLNNKIRRTLSTEAKGNNVPPNTNNAISTRVTVVQVAKAGTWWTSIAILTGICVASTYYIVQELMPSKLSPNSVFNDSFKLVERNTDVINSYGSPLKAYGSDFGGRKAGRRFNIPNSLHTDEDGIQHRKIKYTLEGPSGQLGEVFAEKTSSQGDGDFLYVVVMDKRTQNAIFVIDNREQIPLEKLQENMVEKLNKKGAILYGGDNDRYTIQQKLQFGRAINKIQYVNCENNEALCRQAGVQGLPSWQINGRMTPGLRMLDDLDAMIHGAKMDS